LSATPLPAARRWGLSALIVAVVVAAGAAQTSFGRAQLQRAGLTEEHPSYTSLAFLDPQSLPEQLTSKRAKVNVSFVIRNATSTAYDYQWSVSLLHGKRTHRIDAGSISVVPGRSATITRVEHISCNSGRVRISVNLKYPAEDVDAWAACPPNRS
jgi:hypothetical protein